MNKSDITLGIGYFGAQGTHSKKIFDYIDSSTNRYIDLTAGGLGIPFKVCVTKHIPVTTNDIGYHSYICARTVLMEQPFNYTDDEIVDKFLNFTQYVPGFITKLNNYDWLSTSYRLLGMKQEVCNYLDTVLANNQKYPIIIASVGKFLLSNLTFRGMSFCRKLSNGMKREDIDISFCRDNILKNIKYFTQKQNMIPEDIRRKNYCSYSNASDFVENYDFHNCVVYMDPAWPWNTYTKTNPYFLSSVVIPAILLQTDEPANVLSLKPWGFGHKDIILNDIYKWVNTPLVKGAQRVIVNTQSTNYPDPIKEVEPFLQDRFIIQDKFDWSSNTSLADSQEFGEFAWVLTLKEEIKWENLYHQNCSLNI